jgi:hypothetical protein
MLAPTPQFAGGALASLQKVFSDVYSDTGKRYAFEQTVCFTVPRTTQQLYRNFDLTGETNKMAAWEMLIRDLMADVLDTFAPGLLAYYVVSKILDKRHGTMTRRMMGQDGLQLYGQLAEGKTAINEFYAGVEKALQQATGSNHQPNLRQHVQTLMKQETDWKATVAKQPWISRPWYRLRNPNPANGTRLTIAQQLAAKLGMVDFELDLNAGNRYAAMTLPELLDDLKAIENNVTKHPPKAGVAWGNHLRSVLKETKKLSQHHMWANAVALIASLAMPFGIRKLTQLVTGEDAYPGSTGIQKSMRKKGLAERDVHTKAWHKATNTPLDEGEQYASDIDSAKFSAKNNHDEAGIATASDKKAFKWFPYLSEAAQKGEWGPIAATAGFFAVLTGAVLHNRFLGKSVVAKYNRKLNPFKWKDIVRVYQFQRGFPWTTLAQMELTYGLLCGFRLLSARNDSEWRETALRDALLGWPTLTYGFEMVQKQLGKIGNRMLVNRINKTHGLNLQGNAPVLLRKGGEIRNTDDMTAGMMHNATGLTGQAASKLAKQVNGAWTGLTAISSAISIALLSFLEPMWGINMTTNLELKKHRQKLKNDASPILLASHQPLPPVDVVAKRLAATHHGNNNGGDEAMLGASTIADPIRNNYQRQAAFSA